MSQNHWHIPSLAVHLGDQGLEAICWLNLADALILAGDLNEAWRCIRAGASLAQKMGAKDDIAYAYATMGRALIAQGEVVKARERLLEAVAISAEIKSLWNMVSMWCDLALVSLALSDVTSALDYGYRALARANETSVVVDAGLARDVLAQVEVACGEWQTAQQHFEEAISIFARAGYRHREALALLHYGEALLGREEFQKATPLLQRAMTIFQQLGVEKDAFHAQELLDTLSQLV